MVDGRQDGQLQASRMKRESNKLPDRYWLSVSDRVQLKAASRQRGRYAWVSVRMIMCFTSEPHCEIRSTFALKCLSELACQLDSLKSDDSASRVRTVRARSSGPPSAGCQKLCRGVWWRGDRRTQLSAGVRKRSECPKADPIVCQQRSEAVP